MLIGVLGGGQLGRMIALAGLPLGFRFRFLDPSPDAPAGEVGERLTGSYTDPASLKAFARGLDLVTYEFESVPVEAARWLANRLPVFPPPAALEAAQDRLAEKRLFQKLGIPVPPFYPVETDHDLTRALDELNTPGVLKTRRLGYDGKGQVVIRKREEAEDAFSSLGGAGLILEGFVPFDREVSILAVRSRTGETAFYSLVENHHREGILRLSLAPAPECTPELQQQAERYASLVLDELGYVGVLAIEFFQVNGSLLANEMAPRVHNSGHWTIEGAETSQFENHLRAVAGYGPGSTAMVSRSAMVNLIGSAPDARAVLAVPGAHLHLYGKEPRPGRKLGHVTLRASDPPQFDQGVKAILDLAR